MKGKNDQFINFDTLYKNLNTAQKKAVDEIDGPVMVIAGPGTGKTTVLTLRIANILRKTDVAPQLILALTFTESGVFAMRRKLADLVGVAAYKVNIHTFHGFSEKMIQEYPDYFSRIIGSSVITDAEQYKLIQEIINSPLVDLLRPYGDQAYYVRPVLHEIQILKRENVSPENLLNRTIEEEKNIPKISSKSLRKDIVEVEKLTKRCAKNKELAFVYGEYEKRLLQMKRYDFEDMLLELIRAMENNEEFKLILQENYQYVLADEHQDANASQNRILELLTDFFEDPNIFIVGDDKQAIYRFQGASLDNFLYFKKKYKNALLVDLNHNYRSSQPILDASHSLILNNPGIPGRERVRLISLQMGGRQVKSLEFEDSDQEVLYISNLVRGLIDNGEKPEEIAILYRENSHAEKISKALGNRGIKNRIESDYDLLKDRDVMKIMILSRAIIDPSDNSSLAKALLLEELDCDPAQVREIFHELKRSSAPLHSVLKKAKGNIGKAYEKIKNWSYEAQTMPIADFLHLLVEETGMIESILKSPDSSERLNSIKSFYEKVVNVARSHNTFLLEDFIEYMSIVEEHGISTKRTFGDQTGGVRLMTAHRSKGLEFNHVFIIHVKDGVWGNKKNRMLFNIPMIENARDTGKIEDDRRLFYVALTRARETVTISYSLLHEGKESMASQFIGEIDTRFIIKERPSKVEEMNSPSRDLKQFKGNSLLDKSFVSGKFLRQPLSVTHLNSFLACPWRYFFVNLIRIPELGSKHQMYGTAVHAALKALVESNKGEKRLTKKKFIEIFSHYLDEQPMSERDRKESLEKGKKSLGGYYDAYAYTIGDKCLTEYSVKGFLELTLPLSYPAEKLELTGKLDKIEFLGPEEVLVTDWKTGRPKSRNEIEGKTKDGDGNYKRQLIFYKMLLDQSAKFRMKYGEIDFIEPDTQGRHKRERFEINDQDVLGLKKEIGDMASAVCSLSFVDSECGEKDCEYCKLGKILRDSSILNSR